MLFIFLISSFCAEHLDGINIIPWPVKIEELPGVFLLRDHMTIYIPKGDENVKLCADRLIEVTRTSFGLSLDIKEYETVPSSFEDLYILFSYNSSLQNEEAYRLCIRPYGITIQGKEAHGMYHSIATIQQLFPFAPESSHTNALTPLRCLEIIDYPRYPYRGWMIDTGRHFSSVADIKKDIDLLALHKMSILHFHLTEDQGWRIEIKKYPKLTEIGAWRGRANLNANGEEEPTSGFVGLDDPDEPTPRKNEKYGGFYTQEQIKEIVEYARKHFIRIQPEIEFPGHAVAAIASYPELSCSGKQVDVITSWGIFSPVFCSKELTINFLEDVFTEVMDLFPNSPMLHVGGDECPTSDWSRCQNCKARMSELGISSVGQLHGYFIRRIGAHCAKHGRRLIGWDEIASGGELPADTAIMVWRGTGGSARFAKGGRDVVIAPMGVCYFDYGESADLANANGAPQANNGLQTVYNWDPMVAALGPPPSPMTEEYQQAAPHFIGSQGNLWTEHLPKQSDREYNSFPRLTALAETLWVPYGTRDWDSFLQRLSFHFVKWYEAYNVTYNPRNLLS